jgi:D-2-hydroxyacid dehydrogenase (NADP+)
MKIYANPKTIKPQHFASLKERFSAHEWIGDFDLALEAEVMICNPSFVISANLDRMPKLQWIHLLMSGYNTIDLADLARRGIALTNSKDVFHIQIAEDVFTKILAINRDAFVLYDQMKQRIWKPIPDEREIYGSAVGIVGAGSIASEIAKRMQAFGAKVAGWRRSPEPVVYFDQIYTGAAGLDEMIVHSDYVIVALPLSKETFHLIDKRRLALMKPTAVLINIARGEIINQDDLIEVLQNNQIRAAGLDVVTPEPLPETSPLWNLSNVYLTPHNASSSVHMFPRMIALIEENIGRYERNEALLHIVVPFPMSAKK